VGRATWETCSAVNSRVNLKSLRLQTALRARLWRNMTINRPPTCMSEYFIWAVVVSFGTTSCCFFFFWTNLITVRLLSPQLHMFRLFATICVRPTAAAARRRRSWWQTARWLLLSLTWKINSAQFDPQILRDRQLVTLPCMDYNLLFLCWTWWWHFRSKQ